MRYPISTALTRALALAVGLCLGLVLLPAASQAGHLRKHRAASGYVVPARAPAPVDPSGGNAAAAGNNANSMSGSNSAAENANGRSSGGYGG